MPVSTQKKKYYVYEHLAAALSTSPRERVQRGECGVFNWHEYCAVCNAEGDAPKFATAGCLMSVETQYWRIPQLRSRVKRIETLPGRSCPVCCVCPPCLERVVAWLEEWIAKKQGTAPAGDIQDLEGWDLDLFPSDEDEHPTAPIHEDDETTNLTGEEIITTPMSPQAAATSPRQVGSGSPTMRQKRTERNLANEPR